MEYFRNNLLDIDIDPRPYSTLILPGRMPVACDGSTLAFP
jgi:hypothetical protein